MLKYKFKVMSISNEVNDPNEINKMLKANAGVADIQSVLDNPGVVKIYGNGFTGGYSLSDGTIVIQQSATPVAVIFMSHIALKTLRDTLNELISSIEYQMKEPIKSIQELKNLI